MVEVNEKAPQTIVIGRRGTYNTQEVVFDIGYLIDAYGVGTAVLAVKRSQDSSAYPAVVAQEDSTVTWTVSETDTYYKGAGECELMWYVDGGLAKTIIYPMVVMRDILSTTEEAPDAYQTWVDDLTALGAETLQNAQDAAQSASDAESAKDDAVDAKEAAEEAAEKAEAASVHAPIIYGGYWYIWNNGQYVNTGVRAEGQKGDQGDPGVKGDTGNGIASITKTGTSGLVDTYTVTYTDGTTTTFTVTNGAKGDKGDTGATGNGIQSITKTGTSGNVDTYTITYTNGQTTTFTVTNGGVSSVAGKTGEVTLNANDVAFSESGTYDDGTVGAALSAQKNAIDQLDSAIVNAVAVKGSVSGNPIVITNGADSAPLLGIKCDLGYTQSGSGNPSISNVRPISVLSELDITINGVNLWDEQWIKAILLTDGSVTTSGATNYICSADYVPVDSDTDYYFSFPLGATLYYAEYDSQKAVVGERVTLADSGVITTGSGTKYLKICSGGQAYPMVAYHHDISLNYPATLTEYYPGALAQQNVVALENKSVGTYDGISGVQVLQRRAIDLGSLEYSLNTGLSGVDRFVCSVSDILPVTSTSEVPNLVCSVVRPEDIATANKRKYTWVVAQQNNNLYFYVPVGTYATGEAFAEAMTGQTLLYPLAQSAEYQVEKTSLKTNYLWSVIKSNATQLTVDYAMDTVAGLNIAPVGSIDLNSYSANPGWLSAGKWVNFTTGKHCVIPLKENYKVSVTANNQKMAYIAFLDNYAYPVANMQDAYCIGNRIDIPPTKTVTVVAPNGTNYLMVGLTSDGSNNVRPQDLTIAICDGEDFPIKAITFGQSTTILSNKDASATSLDSRGLTFFNIIQQSASMYYMYYTAWNEAGIDDYTQNFLFAYSTDGINYTRGFPAGIEAPFPGTNRIFSETPNMSGQVVFKCNDPQYPYRLIAQQNEGTNLHYINMYKSEDGINFDLSTKRTLRYEYHDTQNVAVCNGNVIKLFCRENEHFTVGGTNYHDREQSVTFFDLDGNKLLPEKLLPLSFVYNSAAIDINGVNELIIPTAFTGLSQDFSVTPYVVDRYNVKLINSNSGDVFTANDKWALFVPSLMTINEKQYLAIRVQNVTHDGTASADPQTYVTEFRIVEITTELS